MDCFGWSKAKNLFTKWRFFFMKRFILILAALALLFGGVGQARAAPITSLYNSGVDNLGAVLADGTVDSHYNIVSPSIILPETTTARTSASGFPIPPWIADNATSRWIIPTSSFPGGNEGNGILDYRTTFDLTGFLPGTAGITGQYSTDNELRDLLVNGASTGLNNGPTDVQQWGAWFPFTLNSGFVSGINTLDFLVNNDGGPAGFRVELTGTADAAPVPEPATITLLGIGIAGLAGYGWRRRKPAVG
jgi:PEP-CTERM motif